MKPVVYIAPRRSRSQQGSAVVILLVLLSVMAALLVSNAVTLRRLKVELQMLEQKQNRALQGPDTHHPTSDLRPLFRHRVTS